MSEETFYINTSIDGHPICARHDDEADTIMDKKNILAALNYMSNELHRFGHGFQGSCYACESGGIKNMQLQRENDELKAYVERLRYALSRLNKKKIEGYLHHGQSYAEMVANALAETPTQSLYALKLKVAEKVREACVNLCRAEVESRGFDFDRHVYNDGDRVEMLAGNYNKIGEAIRNMDLKEILGEE